MSKTISAFTVNRYIRIAIPIIIGGGGLLSMSLIARFLQDGTIPIWGILPYKVVNFTLTMQLMVLPLSLISITLLYVYDKTSFTTFFRFTIHLQTTLSNQQTNWRFFGPMLAIVFTFGLTLLMGVEVAAQNGAVNETFFKLVPLVLLFAVTNAWSEEIFSRFVIVAGLHHKMKPTTICLISAVLFGLPHFFFGTPSGVFGAIMSGLLGGILAKSVIDTRSLAWALLIHFLLDVVIFGAGAMIIAGYYSSLK